LPHFSSLRLLPPILPRIKRPPQNLREEFIAINTDEGKFPKSFKMGDGDAAHEVNLSRKFSIAKYEVPQNL